MFRHDVYISHADTPEDSTFVNDTLEPKLRRRGLAVRLNSDGQAGRYRVSNIVEAVRNSRKTLVVLTPAWLRDKYCKYQVRQFQDVYVAELLFSTISQ